MLSQACVIVWTNSSRLTWLWLQFLYDCVRVQRWYKHYCVIENKTLYYAEENELEEDVGKVNYWGSILAWDLLEKSHNERYSLCNSPLLSHLRVVQIFISQSPGFTGGCQRADRQPRDCCRNIVQIRVELTGHFWCGRATPSSMTAPSRSGNVGLLYSLEREEGWFFISCFILFIIFNWLFSNGSNSENPEYAVYMGQSCYAVYFHVLSHSGSC